MKFEFSAGGIVYKRERTRKESASRKNAKIYILVSQHSQHHGWVFPKGLIGDHIKGEKKEETAVREVEEETGIKAKIVRSLEPVGYWYQSRGDPSTGSGREKVKKTVYYFLMEYLSGDIKTHDHEMENVEWLPVNEVEKRLTYKSDKEAWKEARKFLVSND